MGPAHLAASAVRRGKSARSVPSLRMSYVPLTGDLSSQPGFRQRPIAHDRAWRDLENFGCLINAESTKVTQLNQMALSLIYDCQAFERVIECHHFRRSVVR